jgi:hypothetical protein
MTMTTRNSNNLFALAAFLIAGTASASGAVELTKDNFSSEVGPKNAFIKFLAPW